VTRTGPTNTVILTDTGNNLQRMLRILEQVDYSRTRGLLGEMLQGLHVIDEERRLAVEAEKKPELGHEPRPAIDAASPGEPNS
jgi:hypothetical protein